MNAGAGARPARIVVGIDGSEQSLDALRWAGRLAARFGSRLDAVTAWEYPTSYGWTSIAPDWNPADDMAKVLDEAVEKVFGDQPPAGLERHVREGAPAKVLLDASHGALMLVVGSRGHGGFAGLLLGSVSANVAEHASCPVLILHGDEPPPAGG
jgi:nucleotide-binding universal stress UspA family protein